jgi:methyltransferase (TIGR00027 family)
MSQLIQNVSDTAFMVAGFRAREMDRPEPLFRDPLAAKLAGEHGQNIVATVPERFVGAWSVVIRTVIIDEFIRRAVDEGVDTVLNLGAGLDTRPYRMELPASLRWVEADFPHVIELKNARLAGEQPVCALRRVSVDLTDRARLGQFLEEACAGARKVLVLTEGVTPYLSEENVAALARDLRREDKIRFWITDYFSREAIRLGKRMRRSFMRNAPFRFDPQDWFGFFAACGWRPREMRYVSEEAERLNRPIPLSFTLKLRFMLAMLLASPEKRQAMKRYVAYVLLAPSELS